MTLTEMRREIAEMKKDLKNPNISEISKSAEFIGTKINLSPQHIREHYYSKLNKMSFEEIENLCKNDKKY